MFKFLKEKIKEAVASISKKAEKEADVVEGKEKIKEEKKGFFSRFKKKEGKSEEALSKVQEPKKTAERKQIPPVKEKEREVTIKEKQKEKAREVQEPKKGFFEKVKEKITTTTISEDKFENLFFELEIALLENNIAIEVIEKIKEKLKEQLVNKPLLRGKVEEKIKKSLKDSIESVLDIENFDLIEKIKDSKKPFVICFFGINGSGKTTTLSKIAHLIKKNNFSVILAAADTFRAASIEQLKEWGNKLNIKVIAHQYGSDPASVSYDAVSYSKAHNIDVVLIDTAGRQHSNQNLMREMEKITRVAKPDLKIFVGESITGNDVIEQANKFNSAVGIDCIVLTKADVDEKGGAIVSVSYVTNKPILYLGYGQHETDLKIFNKEEILKNLGFS